MSDEARLLGAADIRRLAAGLDLSPTKKLGQNFVHDGNTVRRIVRIAAVTDADTVLEVGPGLGSLTLGLLETGARVIAVEIDRRLAALLPETVAELGGPDAVGRLTTIRDDAMTAAIPAGELPAGAGGMARPTSPTGPTRLVANLPYNVAVPVLLRLLADLPSLAAGVVMVQAEVGERLAAGPGSKIYGSPSVKAAWYGRFDTAGTVGRQVFWPVPNVESVLVRFARHEHPRPEAERLPVFRVIDAAFQQRRKTLRQGLSGIAGGTDRAEALLRDAGIDPGERGERLDIEAFVALGRAFAARAATPAAAPGSAPPAAR